MPQSGIRNMIDWHSHVLPAMDDGSRNVEESLSMLRALQSQGIRRVIATPHFYANDESVDRFLERREQSYSRLCGHLTDELPQVMLGAEVRYYAGISRMDGFERLKIESSQFLLLEMPTSQWTSYTVGELRELAGMRDIRFVLAHIDRYFALQHRGVLEALCGYGLLMQGNADFFNSMKSRRKALHLLQDGRLHFLGSDCHNMTSRPPRIGDAYQIIAKRFGEDYVAQMTDFGYRCFRE